MCIIYFFNGDTSRNATTIIINKKMRDDIIPKYVFLTKIKPNLRYCLLPSCFVEILLRYSH